MTVNDPQTTAHRHTYQGDLIDTDTWHDDKNCRVNRLFLDNDGRPIELRCKICGIQHP